VSTKIFEILNKDHFEDIIKTFHMKSYMIWHQQKLIKNQIQQNS